MGLHKGFHQILIISALVVVFSVDVLANAVVSKRWECTSGISRYTHSQCQKKGGVSGCYFLDNFQQYRACSKICNGVVQGSIDEKRCNGHCPTYLSSLGSCSLVDDVSTTTTHAAVNTKPLMSDRSSNNGYYGFFALCSLLVIIPLMVFFIWRWLKKREKKAKKKQDTLPTIYSTQATPEVNHPVEEEGINSESDNLLSNGVGGRDCNASNQSDNQEPPDTDEGRGDQTRVPIAVNSDGQCSSSNGDSQRTQFVQVTSISGSTKPGSENQTGSDAAGANAQDVFHVGVEFTFLNSPASNSSNDSS